MDLLKPSYATGYAKNASQSAHPNLWDGLVGAWMPSLGVTGETLRDVSGNGNHGTLTNMDAASDWVATSKGLALDFDGSNDYVNVNDPDGHFTRSGSDDLTLSCWIKPITKSGYQTLIGNPQNTLSAANFNYLLYRHVTDGSVQLHGLNQNKSSFIPVANEWTHIAATVKSNTYRLYADSILVQQVSGFTYRVGFSTGRLSLCAYLNGYDHYRGSLSNASIYNRALSPTEIKQLYVDSLAPFRRKQRVSVAVPAAVPTPSATYHPLRSLAHPLEQ